MYTEINTSLILKSFATHNSVANHCVHLKITPPDTILTHFLYLTTQIANHKEIAKTTVKCSSPCGKCVCAKTPYTAL